MKRHIKYANVGGGGRDFSTLDVERHSSGVVGLVVIASDYTQSRSVELNQDQQEHLGHWLLNRPVEEEAPPEEIPLIQEFD